jgi:hypothetical protein
MFFRVIKVFSNSARVAGATRPASAGDERWLMTKQSEENLNAARISSQRRLLESSSASGRRVLGNPQKPGVAQRASTRRKLSQRALNPQAASSLPRAGAMLNDITIVKKISRRLAFEDKADFSNRHQIDSSNRY